MAGKEFTAFSNALLDEEDRSGHVYFNQYCHYQQYRPEEKQTQQRH
jgi:hypothetical protein